MQSVFPDPGFLMIRLRTKSVRAGATGEQDECQVMFLSILNAPARWMSQILDIMQHRLNHLSPTEYSVMLIACITIGYTLLKGRS